VILPAIRWRKNYSKSEMNNNSMKTTLNNIYQTNDMNHIPKWRTISPFLYDDRQ